MFWVAKIEYEIALMLVNHANLCKQQTRYDGYERYERCVVALYKARLFKL